MVCKGLIQKVCDTGMKATLIYSLENVEEKWNHAEQTDINKENT